MEFTPFFFDGNRWFQLVDCPEKWRDLLSAYDGELERLLSAKEASLSSIRALPPTYHFGTPGVRTGAIPSFGFRREHIDGVSTLEEWAARMGMDLRALAADHTEGR